MAGGIQRDEPLFFGGGCGGCCKLRTGVLISTSISFLIWLFISCVFWPGIVITSSDTGRFDKPIPLNPDGSPVEAGGEEKCTTVSKETTQTWTLVVPPLISFPGLLVDTIALFRLGACASRTCPDGIAACCNGPIARGPLLLPKLIFHGCLIAFLLVVLVLTNVYFCQELALLINVVVPVIIVFYTCHSVQVWRMRNFKKEIIKEMDAVDSSQDMDPSMLKLINMTRRGVKSKGSTASENTTSNQTTS